jgi:VWFA-related protein
MARVAASVTAALLLSFQTTAQEKPTFSTRSDLVVLHVVVEDRRGTYVSGLRQDYFTVLEDDKPQPVQFFSAADTPASIGLLVDNSTSMMTRRKMAVAAAVGFTEESNPEDEIFVLGFNENVAEIVSPRVIAETNMVSLRALLIGGLFARGKTALYDAIVAGLDRLERGKHSRQVLVLISDGGDNASAATLKDVLSRTRQSEAAIFTVMMKDPVNREGNPRLLKRLAGDTGGEAFEPDDMEDVPETLEHIARDIRSAYTIGFVPASAATDRALRKLRVVVRTPNGTLNARTRGGYAIKEQP